MYRSNPQENAFVVSAVNGVVVAYRLDDGSVAWMFQAPEGTIPFASPNELRVRGNQVFVTVPRVHAKHAFASADTNATVHVSCLDYATGGLIWKRDIRERVGIARVQITLLVEGGRVLVAHNGALFAFAVETGEPAWSVIVGGAVRRSHDQPTPLAGPSSARGD